MKTQKLVQEKIEQLLSQSEIVRNVFSPGTYPHPIIYSLPVNYPDSVIVFDLVENTIEAAERLLDDFRESGLNNVSHPASCSHSNWPAFARRRGGISDSLIWIYTDDFDGDETVRLLERCLNPLPA